VGAGAARKGARKKKKFNGVQKSARETRLKKNSKRARY